MSLSVQRWRTSPIVYANQGTADFRLRAVTFDSVPWVITMKKNEHYFPTVEWIKDPSAECGWRRLTYEAGKKIEGEGQEGVPSVTDDTGEPDDAVAI